MMDNVFSRVKDVQPQIKPLLEGLAWGYSLSGLKGYEECMRTGVNIHATACSQAVQVICSATSVFMVLKTLNIQPPHQTLLSFSCALIPIGTAYAMSQNFSSPSAKRVVSLLHDNLGHLSFSANVISAIALVMLGNPVSGGATLAVLTVGTLHRNHLLPLYVHKIFESSEFYVGTTSRLFFGTPLEKYVAVMELALKVQNIVFKMSVFLSSLSSSSQKTKATAEEVLSIFTKGRVLKMNRAHVQRCAVPDTPDVDYTTIKHKFSEINWEDQLPVLMKKLGGDARWSKRDSQKNPVEYLKDNLNALIDQIQERKITAGAPSDYTWIDTLLRHIAHYLDDCDDIEKADILMRLGIEGGEYCGAGKFEVIEDIYQRITGTSINGMTVDVKIDQLLLEKRRALFEAFFHRLLFDRTSPWSRVFNKYVSIISDTQDVHLRNHYAKVWNLSWGLGYQGAKHDITLSDEPYAEWTTRLFYRDENKRFWSEYENNCVNALIEASGSRLKSGEIYEWWSDWLDAQEESEAKDKLMELAMEPGKITKDGKLTRKAAEAMLFISGVLLIEKSYFTVIPTY